MPELNTLIASPKLPKATARSSTTNGAILPGIDGRSTWARRLRDLMAIHVADLGGDENTSEGERAIIRRACTLIVELEQMEQQFARSEGADAGLLDLYQRTASSMRRLLEAVGLQRRAKDVTPSLGEYLARYDFTPEADADAALAPRIDETEAGAVKVPGDGKNASAVAGMHEEPPS